MLLTFDVLYPDAALLRTALRGGPAYRLPWFDAHLWAYADTTAAVFSTQRTSNMGWSTVPCGS